MNVAYFRMYRDRSELRLELTNEFMSLITLYMLMTFSGDFVSLASTQNDVGYLLIGFTVLNFTINSVPIVIQIKNYFKRLYHRVKGRENIQKQL